MGPDLDRIRKLDHDLAPHRSAIGSERGDMKELYKAARKDGIEPAGYRMAHRLGNFTPTKRHAILTTFRATLEALGLDAQHELKLVHDADAASPAPAREGAERSAKPEGLKPPVRGKVRGRGPLNRRSPKPAA